MAFDWMQMEMIEWNLKECYVPESLVQAMIEFFPLQLQKNWNKLVHADWWTSKIKLYLL